MNATEGIYGYGRGYVHLRRLGRGVNHFRRRKLGLAPLTSAAGSTVVDRLRVPFLYCWSSALIPKPADWMQNIEVTGFLFLENKTYVPPDDLKSFLKEESGERPIYIGFGSIVVADPEGLTGESGRASAGCPQD